MHPSMICPTFPHQSEVRIRVEIRPVTLTPAMGHSYTIFYGIRTCREEINGAPLVRERAYQGYLT